jgi:glycosyltransferase involved in cell wall biosynthesis
MLAGETNFIKRKYLLIQTKRLKKFEKEILKSADSIVPITEVDKKYFESWGISKPYYVSPTGIQLQQYVVNHIQESPFSVFHFGSMDWLPNEEAVLWFINNVWEKILVKIPQAKFYIVGRGMSEKLRSLNKPNIVVVGKTKNAQQVYHQYSVMIVPLLSGSGMRIKMIEGMAYAKAIVSTAIGAEGIDVCPGKNCFIANTPDEFAEAVIKLLTDENIRNSIEAEARIFIEQHFENNLLVSKLVHFYKTL